MPENANEVTAAGIARLAGVGRAAVSNWRRRHADFPKPVGGTDTSPAFALSEVESWLRAQGKLAEVPLRERVWQRAESHPAGTATALRQAGAVCLLARERRADGTAVDDPDGTRQADAVREVLKRHFGGRFTPGSPVDAPLLRAVAELAAETGPRQAYEFLLGRYLDANPRQYALTPPALADLMAQLAGPARTVLDPACGTGALLRAAGDPHEVYGQEADPDLAALAALRLALHSEPAAVVRVADGDSLRADAFPGVAADAVLCHPPFNERNWGHEDLAYDPRWEYGFPARTESELAWVQHCLARVREGGTVVLLMPPAAASRRSGRRIRADLLRRGALRAVVALPAGAAPPYGIPLHLWVLRRPGAGTPASPHLLLVDTAGSQDTSPGAEKVAWQAVRAGVLDAWKSFDRHGTTQERPGVSRAVKVIDLLDDTVDVTPARHLPPPAAGGGAAELAGVRERLDAALRSTAELAPAPAGAAGGARWPLTTVGELARAGALVLRAGGSGSAPAGGPAVLTEHDVLGGGAPSGTLPEGPAEDEPVLTQEGDVVVPVLGRGSAARVVDAATAGAALGRNLHLLRPDPAALDPWFLAGFLRGTANNRRASSYASTATRLDVRRLQVPRLPLSEQWRYGERFRALAAFEEALRLAGQLGEQLVQGLYDGLTDGTVRPE
ncbi:N-6 DNA methylase [Actinacidiphila sp. bgisy167]|uniref:N-6 DNA methylase n=1 Tax=Actinacidiphila sp. bgisy167 TaxID=3413797 RepID=UPI003D7447C0